MLVDLAVPLDPVVEFAFPDGEPGDKARDRDLRLSAPLFGKVNNGVSRVVGNPDAG